MDYWQWQPFFFDASAGLAVMVAVFMAGLVAGFMAGGGAFLTTAGHHVAATRQPKEVPVRFSRCLLHFIGLKLPLETLLRGAEG